MSKKPAFTEAAFIGSARKQGAWTVYPETAGFDILLVKNADGAQFGLEAKLLLNAKVIKQALPDYLGYHCGMTGPDYRAVLIPRGVNTDLAPLCQALGVTVIVTRVEDDPGGVFSQVFWPALPSADGWAEVNGDWHDWCPNQRCKIPDYVPEAAAGRSAPLQRYLSTPQR